MKYWCSNCGAEKKDNKTKIGKFPLCDKDQLKKFGNKV